MSFTNPTRANWQPGHIPQLRYRNPVPAEEALEDLARDEAPLQEITNTNAERRPSSKSDDGSKPSGPTIRQIRQSMIQAPPPAPSPQPCSVSRVGPPSKKKSLFGSLFTVKEPTQMALNQVTAQIIAQHGSTSATKVPNVRMEKMPEHVPKVNSKWDGVPDRVKIKEKQERDRQRALKRQLLGAEASKRSQSADSQERRGRVRVSYASSSNGSRPKSINSNRSHPRDANPHRFYAASCNSSGDLAAQQRDRDEEAHQRHRPTSSMSQSFRSPSGSSLPEMTAFFSKDIPANPVVPEKYRVEASPISGAPSAPDRPLTEANARPIAQAPSVEAIPEHTSSPVATPREGSPVTPLTQQLQDLPVNEMLGTTAAKPKEIFPNNSPTNNVPFPAPKPRNFHNTNAFLAGEAKELQLPGDDERPSTDLPLRSWGSIRSRTSDRSNNHKSIDRLIPDVERRPDSSRARLGLRASMLVRTDATPWEAPDDPSTPPLSPISASTRTSTGPLTPRTFLSKSLVGSLRSTRS